MMAISVWGSLGHKLRLVVEVAFVSKFLVVKGASILAKERIKGATIVKADATVGTGIMVRMDLILV